MRLFILPLAACAVSLPALAIEIPGSQMKSGLWTIAAYTDDATGNFSHCVATVPYRSGISLAFSISDAGSSWRMGLTNPAWSLPSEAKYTISYTVDGRVPAADEAIVAAPQLIMWELPATDRLFQIFRTGRTLTIGAAGANFVFDLAGSAKALNLTLGCATHYRNRFAAGAQSSNPFEKRAPASTVTEATVVLANVLGAAQIEGYKLLAEIPRYLSGFHAAYEAPGVIGGLQIQTATTVPDVAAALVAEDQKGCDGAYASTREKAENGVLSLWSACKLTTGGGVGILYVVSPRASGGVYVFATAQYDDGTSQGPSGAIEDAGNSIFDASIRAIR